MQDDPLTPEERAAIAKLPRDQTPPAHLEDRVVADLHRDGLLRAGRRSAAWWRTPVRVAAAIALVVGGVMFGRWSTSPAEPASGRSFLLLLYGDTVRSGKTEQALVAEYGAWADGLRQRQQLIAAERLQPVVRVVGDASVGTQIAPVGFFLIRADSFEAAAATAADCPHARYGGTVVVRPAG